MKILCIDIETTPNLAHVWGLWDQNVGLNQLLETTELLCFAAKFVGEPKMYFAKRDDDGSRQGMVYLAHSLLDDADVVMHFNGKRFDIPHLNREFLLHELPPPAPYKQMDLLQAVKKKFQFPSNKLEHISTRLKLAGKVKHAGHELWIKCMAGDPAAWRVMRRYNKQDVFLLEEMYEILKPWIEPHPNVALYNDSTEDVCPVCESTNLRPQGFAYTASSKFQRYQCGDCGKWSRSGRRAGAVDVREVAA